MKNIVVFLSFILFTNILWLSINVKNKGYSFFIEFGNSYGLRVGTSVLMRGINIGYVKNIKMSFNTVLVLVYIKSSNIFIPKNAIIETTQTGLFNDSVIDIIPLEKISMQNVYSINVFSHACLESKFLCNSSYIYGERGLNYDDLVRAATRISQRFDDPRFFNLFYIFLQNSIEISEDVANTTSLFYYALRAFLSHLIQ